jgi:hypothetical protein
MSKTTPQEIDPYKLIQNFESLPRGNLKRNKNVKKNFQKSQSSFFIQVVIQYLIIGLILLAIIKKQKNLKYSNKK